MRFIANAKAVWNWIASGFIWAEDADTRIASIESQVADLNRQLTDLRNVITNLGREVKTKPAQARSMNDVRKFMAGDEDA